jgi:hypothetical protein
MGDGDPVQTGAEIALHLDRQGACKSPEVGHLGGILRRDDETEMMPVVEAASREGHGVLANDDDVIKTFPSDRADQPLRICQGDRAETGRSRMPMARMRRMKAAPYAPSRSRIKLRGGSSQPQAILTRISTSERSTCGVVSPRRPLRGFFRPRTRSRRSRFLLRSGAQT